MISPLAHEAIVRISHGIPSATRLPFLAFMLFSLCLSVSFFLFLSALLAAINPFSSAGCNDTAIGGTLSARARGPCPREFMDEYRGEVISLSASRSSRMAGDTQVLRLRSCAVRAGVRRCLCANARGAFRRAKAQDVRADARVLKRRNVPGGCHRR